MPRVVPDQRNKFESDELFKKLSQDVDVSRGFVARAHAGRSAYARSYPYTCTHAHVGGVRAVSCVCMYTCLRLS